VGGFATPSHYISLGDIIPQNVIVPQQFLTKTGEMSDKHFHISSNKKKVKKLCVFNFTTVLINSSPTALHCRSTL